MAILTVEVLANSLRAAEDQSIRAGERFSAAISGFLGTPYQEPHIEKLAKVDIGRYILAQHQYIHMLQPFVSSSVSGSLPQQLGEYVRLVALMDESLREQLQGAIHWYGLAVASGDPAVGYLSAWIGLEYLGALLSEHWHPLGVKVSCNTCGNASGKDRARGNAGIEHALGLAARRQLWDTSSMDTQLRTLLESELQVAVTFNDAETLRNRLVHGFKEQGKVPSDYFAEANLYRRHMIHILNYCIRVMMGKNSRSLIAADHRTRPDFRYSLEFKEPLPRDPFVEQWFNEPKISHSYGRIGSDNTPSGEFEYAQWGTKAEAEAIKLDAMDHFSRGAQLYDLTADPNKREPVEPSPTWEDRAEEPNWRPFVPLEENTSQ